jgi:hypothetical protein
MSFKFISEDENDGYKVSIELHKHSTLPEMLEHFEGFLKACGYQINGMLEVIPHDSWVEEVTEDWEWKENEGQKAYREHQEKVESQSDILDEDHKFQVEGHDYSNPYAHLAERWRNMYDTDK